MVKLVSNVPNLDDIASFTVTGAAADFVYREGEAGHDMYLIQDGQIEILNEDGGQQRQLEVLEPGDFFGELSLLEDQPRTQSARAVTPYRLLRIDRATLHQLVQENPDIALRMLHRLASRRGSAVATPISSIASAAPGSAAQVVPPESRSPEQTPSVGPRAAILLHPASGREFPLKESGELILGRVDRGTGFTPDIDFTSLDTDRTLSRRHATITGRDDGLYVCESSATRNGTFVNGRRITTGAGVKLNDGDHVRFGAIETVLILR